MTTTESVRNWFLTCPTVQEMMNFYADYIGTETIEASIFTVPSTLKHTVDVAGNISYEGEQIIQFTFAISAPFGADTERNLENLQLMNDIVEWIYKQNKDKNFPTITEGSVISIMPKASPHLAGASASVAVYEMGCAITYWRDE